MRTRFLEKISPTQRVKDTKIIFEESVDDSSESTKPITFSWNDLDKLPNSGENVHSSVLSEKVPEERTYRNLRGNPRFMYASVRDPSMLITLLIISRVRRLILQRLLWETLSKLLMRLKGLLL